MSDDVPKYLDHDFPLPYKTIPDGIMILSSNSDTDIFVDDDIIKAENLISVGLSKFEEEAKLIKNHDERLSKNLFRAAYVLGEMSVDISSCIAAELVMKGYKNVTKEALKEEIRTFMASENRRHIEDVINSCDTSSSLAEIFYAMGNIYKVKFVVYNSVKLTPIVLGQSMCPVYSVVRAANFKDTHLKFHNVVPCEDADAFQTFKDAEEPLEEISHVSSKACNHGREHVVYPHTGPAIVYLRNNFFHENTCLEHINNLYPICCESLKRGKSNFIVIADNGPDCNQSSYKNVSKEYYKTSVVTHT